MTATLFARIDSWWKALGVLVAAIATGVTIGAAAVSFFALPALVEANATAIESLSKRTTALELARDGMAAEAQRSREGIEYRLERLECLVVAGRRNTPIEDCL